MGRPKPSPRLGFGTGLDVIRQLLVGTEANAGSHGLERGIIEVRHGPTPIEGKNENVYCHRRARS